MVIGWAELEGNEWLRMPHILSSSSVTGIEWLERYAWLEWAEREGGMWDGG